MLSAKRIFDIILSFIGVSIFSPFLPFIALLIKLDSKGPVFYLADRVGKDMKKFKMYKFRSMMESSFEVGQSVSPLYDPRVRAYQDRLDRRRLDYLKELHMASGLSPDKAEMKSHRDYSLFIGLQQLRHHHNETDFRNILKKVFSDLP